MQIRPTIQPETPLKTTQILQRTHVPRVSPANFRILDPQIAMSQIAAVRTNERPTNGTPTNPNNHVKWFACPTSCRRRPLRSTIRRLRACCFHLSARHHDDDHEHPETRNHNKRRWRIVFRVWAPAFWSPATLDPPQSRTNIGRPTK